MSVCPYRDWCEAGDSGQAGDSRAYRYEIAARGYVGVDGLPGCEACPRRHIEEHGSIPDAWLPIPAEALDFLDGLGLDVDHLRREEKPA